MKRLRNKCAGALVAMRREREREALVVQELLAMQAHALKFHRMLLMQQLQNIQVALATRNLARMAQPGFMEWLEKETRP